MDESSSESSECRVCAQNLGEGRISPGPVIHQGTAWRVEHAYPSSLLGWLVIVLERHAEALHQLEPEEAVELGILQRAVAIALNAKFGTAPGFTKTSTVHSDRASPRKIPPTGASTSRFSLAGFARSDMKTWTASGSGESWRCWPGRNRRGWARGSVATRQLAPTRPPIGS